jgi:hypothetical protein
MLSKRDEMEARVNAFVGSWLDGAIEAYGDDFLLGEFAVVFEVTWPPSEEGAQSAADVGWTCTDGRDWVQAGVFRRGARAHRQAPGRRGR